MHWKLRFSPRLLPRSLSWSYTLVFSVRHCFQPSFTGAQNCTLRRSRRSTCLAACWPPLNCLWATLGSTLPWLATIPPLPCSTRHLPVLTPCLDRCFTITSQILQRNLRTLFLVSFKTAGRRFFDHRPAFFDRRPAFFRPPAGVFSTAGRRFFDHRPAFFRPPTGYQPATDRLPTGYCRLPTGYRPATDRLPPATDRLPPATAGYRPATVGYRPAIAGYRPATAGYRRLPTGYRPATDRLPPPTDRLPPATDLLPTGYRLATTGYRRLPTGYRRLPTGYRRLPPATDRLPTGYRRLPPTTAGYRPATNRLPPVQKKKKKKIFFLTPEECHSCSLQTEFPIWRLGDADRAQKFSGHVLQNEDGMCVSLYIYIWTLNT